MKTCKQRLLALLLTLLLLFSLSACGSAGSSGRPAEDSSYNGDMADKGELIISSEALPADRILIKTVEETVETLDYDAFIASLKEAVAEAEGYFSSSYYRNGSYSVTTLRTATLTIRIPAARLSAFCDTVAGLAHVTYSSEMIDDITLSYVAIESRIAVLENEETALLAMLNRAESTTDALSIRKQVEEVQESLAELRAKKRVYDDQVAYSTIDMTVREVKQISEDTTQMSFFEEIGHSFSESLAAVGAFFRAAAIFLIGSSPVLLVWAAFIVAAVFLVRYLLRRHKKKRDGDGTGRGDRP